MSQPIFAVRTADLHKSYGEGQNVVRALNGVDLAVPTGRFLTIMGPSGSGKTTLLQMMAGLDDFDSGEVWVDSRPLSALSERNLTRLRCERIGFIFQSLNLISTLTAAQNIVLPCTISRSKIDANWLEHVVSTLQISALLHKKPHELSGGQQQRVAIARALLTRPAVIFADEATGNLDTHSSAQILDLLRSCVAELNQTVVMVTHDPVAAAYADEVVLLVDGQIRERFEHPTVPRVLAAFNRLNDRDAPQ